MSLLVTASVTDRAELMKDNAAAFLSAPVLLPKSASMPWTTAGMNATPLSSFARKFIWFSPLLVIGYQLSVFGKKAFSHEAHERHVPADCKVIGVPRFARDDKNWSVSA